MKGYSYFSIIRHAERADRIPKELQTPWPIKDDPPLSKAGFLQATHAGKELAKYFKEQSLDFD